MISDDRLAALIDVAESVMSRTGCDYWGNYADTAAALRELQQLRKAEHACRFCGAVEIGAAATDPTD